MTKLLVAAHTFLLRSGSVLLVRRCNTGFEDRSYGPVGGRLEGHESIKQTAIRECREEIDVEIDPADLKIIGVTHYDSPTGEGIDFFLSTTRWAGEPYPRSECDEVRWCPFNELPQNTIPFVRRAIEHHIQAGLWFDEISWEHMKIGQREFCGETDKQAMIALARAFSTDNLHVVDLPYRLSSWALDYPDNIGLWLNTEGQLLAWAVMQTPFWTIDYVYHPEGGTNLHRQILAWADHRARQVLATPSGRPCWSVMVFASQTDRIRDLEEAGFVSQANAGEDSWSKVLMQRAAQIPVADYALPAGFIIRPLAGEKKVGAYVQLHRAVFGSKNMTAEWRTRTLRRPEYLSDLDLVAVAPHGRLAAFCVCWLNKDSEGKPSGQIEPLGVHKDFRKLGLGRAILSEGLRRLCLCGADRIYVETDRYRNAALELYEAVGFRPIQDVLVYRKDSGDARG